MRYPLFLTITLLVLGGMLYGQDPAPAAPKENVAFKWAFAVAGGKSLSLITKDTSLKSGDDIKMFVQLEKECFVYVVHASSKGEIDLLFPYSVQQFSSDYQIEKNYYVPVGRKWLQLDDTKGKETFYVLASIERLLELEAMLGDYQTAIAEKKVDLGTKIVAEIRDARRRYKTFATIAEKPITIGGNIRALEQAEAARRPDIAEHATRITANNFFSKTYTIDHQ
jgi:hypothetical protein